MMMAGFCIAKWGLGSLDHRRAAILIQFVTMTKLMSTISRPGVAKDIREELTGRNLLARPRPNFLTQSYSNIQICPAEKL